MSVLWGYVVYWVKLSGEDISCYSNEMESFGLRKYQYGH